MNIRGPIFYFLLLTASKANMDIIFIEASYLNKFFGLDHTVVPTVSTICLQDALLNVAVFLSLSLVSIYSIRVSSGVMVTEKAEKRVFIWLVARYSEPFAGEGLLFSYQIYFLHQRGKIASLMRDKSHTVNSPINSTNNNAFAL